MNLIRPAARHNQDDEDEKPILSLPDGVEIHHKDFVHPISEEFESAPACGLCCNTKCGATFVATMGFLSGFMLLFCDTFPNQHTLSVYGTNNFFFFYWGVFLMVASALAFHGIRTEAYRFLQPLLAYQWVHMMFVVFHGAFILMKWDFVSQTIRKMLLETFHEIEDNMGDNDYDYEVMQEVKEIDNVVTDDNSWAQLAPTIMLLVVFTHLIQLITAAWFTWVVSSHRVHLIRKEIARRQISFLPSTI